MTDQKHFPTTISLVVLVRDEAADLQRLLSWHAGLYDEAIVVDTGSADASAHVALEAGARVTPFPWCDDFSAARNHGLGLAAGKWILVLDCDELVAPADFPAIRHLCDAMSTAWDFSQRNYCGVVNDPQWVPLVAEGPLVPTAAAGYVDTTTCRLFPNRPDVRYEGIVHELPNRSLARAQIGRESANIVIHHYGHLAAGNHVDLKNQLYGRMLRKKLRELPEDPTTRYEMAVQLLSEGATDLARRLLERTVTEAPTHDGVHRAQLLLGRLLVAAGRSTAGLANLESAVRRWPALREGWVDTVRAHTELKDYTQAALYVKQGRFLFPRDPVLLGLEDQIRHQMADID